MKEKTVVFSFALVEDSGTIHGRQKAAVNKVKEIRWTVQTPHSYSSYNATAFTIPVQSHLPCTFFFEIILYNPSNDTNLDDNDDNNSTKINNSNRICVRTL